MGSKINSKKGFTLIEILVVMGLIAVLAAIVLIAINPARQFAMGRDSQRQSNLNAILNAVGQRMADNKGVFAGVNPSNGKTCPTLPGTTAAAALPVLTTDGAGGGQLGCLVPTYMPTLPIDPAFDATGTNTGYTIYVDTTGRVHVIAATLEPTIPRPAAMELFR